MAEPVYSWNRQADPEVDLPVPEPAPDPVLEALNSLTSAILQRPEPQFPDIVVPPAPTLDADSLAKVLGDQVNLGLARLLAALPKAPDSSGAFLELAAKIESLGKITRAAAASGGGGSSVGPFPLTLTTGQVTALNPVPVDLGQDPDPNNTTTYSSANGTTQFVGGWFRTRSVGYVRQLTVLASNVASGLGGTFVFEYSEDGSNATISESRTITDFATVRDFDLLNAGEFYRIKFTPSRALTAGEFVFITTTQRKQNDGAFVRLAGQQIEEANAAMPQTFAYLKGFDPRTGKSVNIRPDETGALRIRDAQSIVDASGSRATTGTRDDISLKWSRDSYATALTRVQAVPTQVGTLTQNATEGRAILATGAGTNRVCWYESIKPAVYEPGHEIFGQQTVVLLQALTGTAEVRFGYMEDDGAGNILNGIGQGLDSGGLFYWRTKNSTQVTKVYTSAGNRDHLDGVEPSLFRKAGVAVAFNPANNSLYRYIFEWLGISPPSVGVQSPEKPIVEWHVEETSNSQTGTTIPEPALPLAIRLFSGNMSGGISIETGSWVGGVYTNKVLPQPSTTFQTGQATVQTTANQIAPTPLLGRSSIRLTNSVGSARSLFYGPSGVTTATGDELAPGASVDLDLGETVKVYVITTSTAGSGVQCSWIEMAT